MNTFHWHLTDDQGWRIEIKKYPKLTEVGGWRKGSQVWAVQRAGIRQHALRRLLHAGADPRSGCYAAARHINVVPEIEMPGHAHGGAGGVSGTGCTRGPYEVERGWGVFDDVFCPGNDTVFTVLEDVLTEVMELFPSHTSTLAAMNAPKSAGRPARNAKRG
jgi:hexosaminidase